MVIKLKTELEWQKPGTARQYMKNTESIMRLKCSSLLPTGKINIVVVLDFIQLPPHSVSLTCRPQLATNKRSGSRVTMQSRTSSPILGFPAAAGGAGSIHWRYFRDSMEMQLNDTEGRHDGGMFKKNKTKTYLHITPLSKVEYLIRTAYNDRFMHVKYISHPSHMLKQKLKH